VTRNLRVKLKTTRPSKIQALASVHKKGSKTVNIFRLISPFKVGEKSPLSLSLLYLGLVLVVEIMVAAGMDLFSTITGVGRTVFFCILFWLNISSGRKL
jgi:hypothetical protein